MRMTNKIMQNNSLYNINQNKILQDKLSTQMSTQKKLTRPSDDPVVAIRSLRLRSSVSELTQYSKKNAPDAESWLKVTEDGLGTVTDILTKLSTNANKGANKDLTADDLDIIVTQMRSLTQEFYSTGNLDYAGRYVFTGYRTDTPMSFTSADIANKDEPIPDYDITEQTNLAAFDVVNYTYMGDVKGVNINNYSTHNEVEQTIKNGDIHRLRMAYESLDKDTVPTVTIKVDPEDTSKDISLTPAPVSVALDNDPDPYKQIQDANENGDALTVFIPETGELLLSDAVYDAIDGNADINEKTEIQVEYKKLGDSFVNGDLRPEHYFYCENSNGIIYNKDYIDPAVGKQKQIIEYDVGYNQTIEVNTTADEVFTHNLARDITDLENALDTLKSIETTKKDLEKALDNLDAGSATYEADKDQITKLLDSTKKAYTYIRENMHDMMQKAISKTQAYLDMTNVAVTNNGTRSSRLSLISNRLTEQKTTFETLKSENEDADIAEVAVELTSAELTYESSLMATSKIMQTTLMNYI